MSSVNEFYERWNEQIKLVAYFAIVTGTAGVLFPTLGVGWKESTLIRPLIVGISVMTGIGFEAFAVICFGGFLGILGLITFDRKKRWQGILLWIGTAVAVIALASIGLLIPNLDLFSNIPWLLLGIGVGALLGGGRKLGQIVGASGGEVRRAAIIFLYLSSALVVLGLLEYHVLYPELLNVRDGMLVLNIPQQPSVSVETGGLFGNSVTAVVFLATLNRFVKYDAEAQFFVLGPPNSGKSLFLVGAYLSALEVMHERHEGTSPEATSDLMDLVGELDTADPDAGWSLSSTGQSETRNLEFQYVNGRVFPMNVQLSSLDYAGEFLRDLPDALTADLDEIDNPTLQRLAAQVKQADTLILLIDCEKFDESERLNIEPYFDILQATGDKDVKLVATKADVLGENFRDQQALEPHNYFDEFVDYVNQQLSEYNQQVRTLVQSIDDGQIHPVYYQTKLNEEDERVPMRDQKGNVLRNGFRQLLEKLG